VNKNNTYIDVKLHADLEGNNIAYRCTMNGQPQVHVPIDPANIDYIDLKAKIDAGDIVVGAADEIVT